MMTIKVNSMNSVSEYVKYDLYYTQTGQSDPILVDSITIPVLADGVEGAAGKIMYFAGEWKSGQLYEADETSTPYVYDENGKDGYNYFFLIRTYASLRAPSLITTGITIGSCPYFSANEAFAFSMNES